VAKVEGHRILLLQPFKVSTLQRFCKRASGSNSVSSFEKIYWLGVCSKLEARGYLP
jgi:hypothetical protein